MMDHTDTNLYDETIAMFLLDGYTTDDVVFISLNDYQLDPDEFWTFAKRFNYYSGYGSEEVPPFIISMKDGSWYERTEYDGSEWWNHISAPSMPTESESIADILAMDSWNEWRWPRAVDLTGGYYIPDFPNDELEDEEWRLDELEERYEHVRTAPIGDNEEIMSRRYRREWRELHPSRCWKDQRKRAHSWER